MVEIGIPSTTDWGATGMSGGTPVGQQTELEVQVERLAGLSRHSHVLLGRIEAINKRLSGPRVETDPSNTQDVPVNGSTLGSLKHEIDDIQANLERIGEELEQLGRLV